MFWPLQSPEMSGGATVRASEQTKKTIKNVILIMMNSK